ncbi:MAG TPA: GxxExxY protein [Terriglobia bacterium]
MEQSERDPRACAILGAAMEVRRQLGCGFLEAVYREAMMIELEARGIPFRCEVELPVSYKGQRLRSSYRADFICFDEVVAEIKALDKLGGVEAAQVINYLKSNRNEGRLADQLWRQVPGIQALCGFVNL